MYKLQLVNKVFLLTMVLYVQYNPERTALRKSNPACAIYTYVSMIQNSTTMQYLLPLSDFSKLHQIESYCGEYLNVTKLKEINSQQRQTRTVDRKIRM